MTVTYEQQFGFFVAKQPCGSVEFHLIIPNKTPERSQECVSSLHLTFRPQKFVHPASPPHQEEHNTPFHTLPVGLAKPPVPVAEESTLGFAHHTTAVVDVRCCSEGDNIAALAAAEAAEAASDTHTAVAAAAPDTHTAVARRNYRQQHSPHPSSPSLSHVSRL